MTTIARQMYTTARQIYKFYPIVSLCGIYEIIPHSNKIKKYLLTQFKTFHLRWYKNLCNTFKNVCCLFFAATIKDVSLFTILLSLVRKITFLFFIKIISFFNTILISRFRFFNDISKIKIHILSLFKSQLPFWIISFWTANTFWSRIFNKEQLLTQIEGTFNSYHTYGCCVNLSFGNQKWFKLAKFDIDVLYRGQIR